ncbi:hypothetical protein WICMUC_003225 [Wickerhamomyces mucosus]|uniref:Major facilitator superfamily (MFS) profile domain-containing protein n=1 Tax=Wickerhamomyces mucosus TaxID=1378264 RepID=A0A9P8PLN2_9ASCO|nr:hypothetical protein WICMUC_003225 [Wickerhamomyces mucosus]
MLSLDGRPTIFKNGYQELAAILTVMFAQTLNQAGTTQVLPLMNILETSFDNVTSNDKSWFMASFPLTSGAFILISGKFGDLYGLKRVMLYGIIWAAIWSLISGLTFYSHNVIFFCISRSMSGIGLAFVLPNAIGVIGNCYPPGQRKALVFGAVGACAPFGATMGAIFGGLTAHTRQWPWAFYAYTISLVIVGCLAFISIPDIKRQAPKEVTMDWLGALFGVVGLVLFNFSWNQAPAVGWKNPYILVLLILGIFAIAAFFYVEKRVKYPLIPNEIMNLHLLLILSVVAFGWASFGIWTFYYWCFALNLKDWTPTDTGLSYITLLIFGIIAAFSVSIFIQRVKPSYILMFATVGFFCGITMLAVTPVNQSYYRMILGQMVILSFGMDLSFPASSLILSDNLPKKHQGMASSLVSTFINYSMSISLGIAGTAESEIFSKTQDILKSYRAAMYVGIGFASLGVLFSFVLHIMSYVWNNVNKDFKDGHVDDKELNDSSKQDSNKVILNNFETLDHEKVSES